MKSIIDPTPPEQTLKKGEGGWKYGERIERDLDWEKGCNGLLWMAWVALFGRQEIPNLLLVSR